MEAEYSRNASKVKYWRHGWVSHSGRPCLFLSRGCVDVNEYSCAREKKCSVNPELGSLIRQNPAGNRASSARACAQGCGGSAHSALENCPGDSGRGQLPGIAGCFPRHLCKPRFRLSGTPAERVIGGSGLRDGPLCLSLLIKTLFGTGNPYSKGEILSPFVPQTFLSTCYVPRPIHVIGNTTRHELLQALLPTA